MAYSLYDINDDGIMTHNFFIKENDAFVLKTSALENFISVLNKDFLVYKYLPNYYRLQNIAINRVRAEDFNFRSLSQRNALDLMRVAEVNKIKSLSPQMRPPFVFEEKEECTNCQESGLGVCDGGLYCSTNDDEMTDPGICSLRSNQDQAIVRNLLTQNQSISLFDLEFHREFRDNFLIHYRDGKKMIDYYYSLSKFLTADDLQTSTLIKSISVMPSLKVALAKLKDSNYNGNDIIISSTLKN